MTGKRKRYSADFKGKVALEAIRGELTLAQLAAKHGPHQTLINLTFCYRAGLSESRIPHFGPML